MHEQGIELGEEINYIKYAIKPSGSKFNKPESNSVAKPSKSNKKYNKNFKEKDLYKLPRHGLKYFKSTSSNSPTTDNEVSVWTLDSGPSYHMTYDLKSLHDVVPYEQELTYANGRQNNIQI